MNLPIMPFEEFLQYLQNMDLPPLIPIQLDGNQTILSNNMPRRYLVRQIGMAWHRSMEEVFDDVPVGTRILVRRDIVFNSQRNHNIITDYITTRINRETFMGYWTHQDVVYMENEVTPYPFDIDAYHQRDEILFNHQNNQNNPHQVNPLGEGEREGEGMDIDQEQEQENQAALFLQPPPPLLSFSSSSLLSFNNH